MMRFLLSILLVHFCFVTVVSCSTQGQNTDEAGDFAEPSSDEPAASNSDDDLESELSDSGSASKDEPVDELEASEDSKPVAEGEPQDEKQLEDELAEEDLKETPVQKEEPVVMDDLKPAAQETVKITDIRFMSNSNGGTLVVESSGPVSYTARMSGPSQYIIEVENVELASRLKSASLLRNLSGSFGRVGASQDPGSTTAKIIVQLANTNGGEPIVQAEGNTLVVVPPAPPVVVQAPRLDPVTSEEPYNPSIGSEKPREGALAARTLDEFLSGNQRFYGKPLSIQVRDADVRDVINFIADDSGANLVISEDVSGKISLKLRKIPWDQALVTIMRTKKLGYIRQGNVLRITTLKELQEEADASAKIIESQKAISPTVVKVYPVSFANLDELAKNIKVFLTPNTGNVLIDNRTSTIVVTDKEAVMDRVAKLIKTMDVAPTQVMIEGKIVEALETFSSFMGINWGMTGASKTLANKGGLEGGPIDFSPNARFGGTLDTKGFVAGLSVGTLDILGDLSATLALAEQDAIAHVISSPRISVLNREKADIIQSGETISKGAIVTASGAQNVVTRDKLELKLSVTPQITADGSVIMEVDVVRQFAGAVADTDTQARPINTRSAKTKVMVRNAQTAVIGGIFQSDETNVEDGVPGLKDVPVLGWLFKTKAKNRIKNELLLFLTPRILSGGLTPNDDKG